QHREIALRTSVVEKADEAFNDARVALMRRSLSLDRFRFEPLLAPRFDRRARQAFSTRSEQNVAHALRHDRARAVLAERAVARFERSFMPRTSNLSRLSLIARPSRSKNPARLPSLSVENAKRTKKVRSPSLLVNRNTFLNSHTHKAFA